MGVDHYPAIKKVPAFHTRDFFVLRSEGSKKLSHYGYTDVRSLFQQNHLVGPSEILTADGIEIHTGR